MDERRLELVHPTPPPETRQVVPSPVLGTSMFVLTEIMMFAGFISAFVISKAEAPVWPPPGQPRLPIESTGFNTAMLLASGVLLYVAWRRFQRDPTLARLPMLASIALGALFVVLQGMEWVDLVHNGLTLTSTAHGSFFFLIVGAHGLHVTAGLLVYVWVYSLLHRGQLSAPGLQAMQIFWYFVVGLWPVLYWQVYL